MDALKKMTIALIQVLLLMGCVKDVTVKVPPPADAIVVEGYIENGKPPYLLLTKNSAYFGGISLNDLSSYFIHNATVKVFDGTDTVVMTEFCLGSLSDTTERLLAKQFGFYFSDTLKTLPNICIYTVSNIANYYLGDTNSVFRGKVNHSYGLVINVNGKTLTSRTYIPGLIPVQLSYKARNLNAKDSLVTLQTTFDEPDTPGNCVRYFTQRNAEPFYPAAPSVFNDDLFNGRHYTFPALRGQDPSQSFTEDSTGYFKFGDTIQIKWAQIDKQSYAFWHTVESDLGATPISTPIQILTNINGGLGVWCGYGAYYGSIRIPK